MVRCPISFQTTSETGGGLRGNLVPPEEAAWSEATHFPQKMSASGFHMLAQEAGDGLDEFILHLAGGHLAFGPREEDTA